MPYAFPHEDLFALSVGVLILGILAFRITLIRRRRSQPIEPVSAPEPALSKPETLGD